MIHTGPVRITAHNANTCDCDGDQDCIAPADVSYPDFGAMLAAEMTKRNRDKFTMVDLEAFANRMKEGEELHDDDVCRLVVGYGQLLGERDTLAAELVALRAGLPRWRKDGSAFVLTLGPVQRWVWPIGNGWRAMYHGASRHTRHEAMLVVTDALGLPPCEVEGE